MSEEAPVKITEGSALAWLLANDVLAKSRPLREGCEHRLLALPIVQMTFDFVCQECQGIHRQPWTSELAGLGCQDIYEYVGTSIGGRVVAEVKIEDPVPTQQALLATGADVATQLLAELGIPNQN